MANSLNWRGQIVFNSGDTIRVHQTIIEGDKTRSQIFEGIVIRIRGHLNSRSFTVRKLAVNSIGVERIFPENTPTVTKIEVKKQGKVRRAVLTYLSKRVGRKATKIKDIYIKTQSGSVETPEGAVSVAKKVDTPLEHETAELVKNKTAKRDKPIKIKKVKKGPKKIVRKERTFVR
jgi:large subunit ribosomal protein L19